MTANAMKGDMELCLEAGMDDYVTKPIKREIVFGILDKWVFNKEAAMEMYAKGLESNPKFNKN